MAAPSIAAPSETAAPQGGFEGHLGAFASATLASRVLGYARDAAIAYAFGGGVYTDCYYAAFRVANFARRALGEGAVSAALVPVLSRVRRDEGEPGGRAFADALWTGLLLLAALLAGAGMLLAKPLMLAVTYGFASEPGKLALTAELARLLFPFLVFITAAALAQGMLFSSRRFFVAALSPAGLSLSILAYIGLLRAGALPFADAHQRILGLAMAATLGSALQWLLQLPALRREGLLPRPRSPFAHPGVVQAIALLVPSFISVAAEQVDALISTVFASFLAAGSITAAYNAGRVAQLPLALIGVSAATVALTHLSAYAAASDDASYRRTLGDSLGLAAFLLLPASAGLLALARPIVALLFQHGAFTAEQSALTAEALSGLALGVAGYGWTKILVMAHYARKDATTPLRAGVLKAGINASLCWLLMPRLGLFGLMLASSLSAWLCAGTLLWSLRGTGGLEPGIWKPAGKSLAASALLYSACRLWLRFLFLEGYAQAWLQVASTIVLALPLYYGLAASLGLRERKGVAAAFSKSPIS